MSAFFTVVASWRGEEVATRETAKASRAIDLALSGRRVRTADAVDAFLASEYGTYMAQDVMKGIPVERQIEERTARFLRHWDEVVRRTA